MMYLTGFDPLLGGRMAMLVALRDDATVEMVGVRGFVIVNLQREAKKPKGLAKAAAACIVQGKQQIHQVAG